MIIVFVNDSMKDNAPKEGSRGVVRPIARSGVVRNPADLSGSKRIYNELGTTCDKSYMSLR